MIPLGRTAPSYAPLLLLALVACSRGPSPTAAACQSDKDCAWLPDCCPGCGDFIGPWKVVTRAEADAARASCEDEHRECPTYDCASPPPCVIGTSPACVAGKCTVRGGAVLRFNSGGKETCSCDGCGPAPDLAATDACGTYRQLMYERCCCLHSGISNCTSAHWVGWSNACAMRDQCAPDAATLARFPDLDGCAAR